jgi:hypothetical protein
VPQSIAHVGLVASYLHPHLQQRLRGHRLFTGHSTTGQQTHGKLSHAARLKLPRAVPGRLCPHPSMYTRMS